MIHTLGASSIATVLGLNKYMSPQELWEEMVGLRERVVNDHMLRGSDLEEGILRIWKRKTGGFTREQVRLSYPDDKRLGATLDALAILDGELIVVETKSPASGHDWKENDPENCPPKMYIKQVEFQLGVAAANGHDCAYGELAALVWGKLARFRIEPNPSEFESMVKRAQQFLSFVEAKEPLPVSWQSTGVAA